MSLHVHSNYQIQIMHELFIYLLLLKGCSRYSLAYSQSYRISVGKQGFNTDFLVYVLEFFILKNAQAVYASFLVRLYMCFLKITPNSFVGVVRFMIYISLTIIFSLTGVFTLVTMKFCAFCRFRGSLFVSTQVLTFLIHYLFCA